MTKFTKKQLTRIIEAANEVITALADENPDLCKENNDGMIRAWDYLNDDAAPPEVVREMARQLLAGMVREPVAYMVGTVLLENMTQAKAFKADTALEIKPLYAAPQLPLPVVVVPKEIKHRLGGLDWGWEGEFNRGWNACRAAMLHGAEPVSQPYTLSDGWVAVPSEPTQEMLNAWLSEIANWRGHVAGYKAMLAAAPQQETDNG